MITPALDRLKLTRGRTKPDAKDVSEPVTIDTLQEAQHVWAESDAQFVKGQQALDELKSMTPLDRVRFDAAIADAKKLLAAGNWREAQGPLVTAEQIAGFADANAVVRELLAHLRHLRAYGNYTHDGEATDTKAGGKPWPRPQLPLPTPLSNVVALARAYTRVEHGREERVSGYQGRTMPPVTAAGVEEHIATAHGRGQGWVAASGANPLIKSQLTTAEMLRIHQGLHKLDAGHTHSPVVCPPRKANPMEEFQHAMVASAFTTPEQQTAGTHHMVQGHPRTEVMAKQVKAKRVPLGRRA